MTDPPGPLSWAFLRVGLAAGAAYDILFAVLAVLAPNLPASMLGLPPPTDGYLLWLMAILLFMLATLYLLACRDPRRYGGVIEVAIVGRALGAAVFGVLAWRDPGLGGLWLVAAADAGFAVWHAVTWAPYRVPA